MLWTIGNYRDGSVRLTMGDTGAALSSIDYDPWGQVERGAPARFGFTGELQQGSNVHLRARWYNAASGSFASVDPYAGDPASPASLAPYMYAYNQPTGFTDPSGRCILGIVIDTIVCAAIGYTLLAGGFALGVYATAKAVECAQQSCLVPPVQNLINSFQPSAPPSTDTGTKDDTTLVLMPEGNNEGPGEPPSGLGRGAKIAAGITAGLIVASSIPIPPCATDTTSKDDSTRKKVLVVGDGNFDYSRSLANEKPELDVYGTRGPGSGIQTIIPPKVGNLTLMDNVDARELSNGILGGMRFDAIIFNNPHMEPENRKEWGPETARLIQRFISSARPLLKSNGEIHINVTNSLLREYSEVRQVLSTATMKGAIGSFGDSPYYAPYIPLRTDGRMFRTYWDDPNQARLLRNFVFK